MAKGKKARLPVLLDKQEEQIALQLAEGRRLAYMEEHQEYALHQEARSELHHLKPQAVKTLQLAMQNTTHCVSCGSTGLFVDKTAVAAALGVLDRAGLPPSKTHVIKEAKQTEVPEKDLGRRAVMALAALEAEQIGQIIGMLVQERPDARTAIVRAVMGEALIEAEMVG